MSGYYWQPCDVYDVYPSRRHEPAAARPLTSLYSSSDRKHDGVIPNYSYAVQESRLKRWFADEPGHTQLAMDRTSYFRNDLSPNLNLQTVFKRSFRDNSTAVKSTCSSLVQTCNEKSVSTSALVYSKTADFASETDSISSYICARVEVASSCCSLRKEKSSNTLPEYKDGSEEQQIKCSIQIRRHASDMETRPSGYCNKNIRLYGSKIHSSEKFILKPRQIDTKESCKLCTTYSDDNAMDGSESNSVVNSITSFIGRLFSSPIIQKFNDTSGSIDSDGSLLSQKKESLRMNNFTDDFPESTNNAEGRVLWSAHERHRNTFGRNSRRRRKGFNREVMQRPVFSCQPMLLLLFLVGMYFLNSFVNGL